MSTEPSQATDRRRASFDPGARRLRVRAIVACVAVAVVAGAAFAWLPLRRGAGDPPEPTSHEQTIARLPEADAAPVAAEAHFPAIEGLQAEEPSEEAAAEVERRHAPLGGDSYSETAHRRLHRDGEAVAAISLLRVDDPDLSASLQRTAVDYLASAYPQVEDHEVGSEQVLKGEGPTGAGVLWLPDGGSVVLINADDASRADHVIGEVITAVHEARGQ